MRPLTPQEKQDAVDIVKAYGVMERINGGQDWNTDGLNIWGWYPANRVKVIRFRPKWRDPVDHKGPWAQVHCGGTRKVVHKQSWSQITRLAMWVDLEPGLWPVTGLQA